MSLVCRLQAQIKAVSDKVDANELLATDYERQCNKLRLDNEKLSKDCDAAEEKLTSMTESLASAMADLNDV